MAGIIDGVIIAVLAIAVLLGLTRGFIKSIWGLITLAAIVGCLFVAVPPLTKVVLDKTSVAQSIESPVENFYAKIDGMDSVLYKDTLESGIALLRENKAPESLVKLIEKYLTKNVPSEGISAKKLLASKTAELALMLGVGIVLIIVMTILLRILKTIFVGISRISIIKPVDKILGIVYCTVLTAVVLIAVGGLAYTLSTQNFMSSVNDAAQNSTVFRYFYNENPLQSIISKYVNLGDLLKK